MMHQIRKFQFFALILMAPLFFTACQVYESPGKVEFEKKAQELALANTTQDMDSLQTTEYSTETCWTQPANESLWQNPSHFEKIEIRTLNDNEIEACLKTLTFHMQQGAFE